MKKIITIPALLFYCALSALSYAQSEIHLYEGPHTQEMNLLDEDLFVKAVNKRLIFAREGIVFGNEHRYLVNVLEQEADHGFLRGSENEIALQIHLLLIIDPKLLWYTTLDHSTLEASDLINFQIISKQLKERIDQLLSDCKANSGQGKALKRFIDLNGAQLGVSPKLRKKLRSFKKNEIKDIVQELLAKPVDTLKIFREFTKYLLNTQKFKEDIAGLNSPIITSHVIEIKKYLELEEPSIDDHRNLDIDQKGGDIRSAFMARNILLVYQQDGIKYNKPVHSSVGYKHYKDITAFLKESIGDKLYLHPYEGHPDEDYLNDLKKEP